MRTMRIGIVGCGSVSEHYLADLAANPRAEVVAVCDLDRAQAEARAARFGVECVVDRLDDLFAVPFELLVNLTAMPAHGEVSLAGLGAGRHVWTEKPLATSLADGRRLVELARERGLRLWAAPTVVLSPAFAALRECVSSGELGRVHAARACYGHSGPTWGPWFYGRGGGCLFDLAVYNLTTLTALLGPARGVVALAGTAVRERLIDRRPVTVEAEDNAMLLLDHGEAVYSSVATGFVYGSYNEERTIELIGTRASAYLLGWDWAPRGVELHLGPRREVRAVDQAGYTWQGGASHAVDCLLDDRPSPITPAHALHVLEIMLAAQQSAAESRRVAVETRFAASA